MAWISLSDDTLGVSLQAPVGWSRGATDTFPVQLRAPEANGFRPVCALSHEHFEPPTPEGLATFVTHTAEAQRRDYEGHRQEGHREIVVDNRPGSVVTYSWAPAGADGRLVQVLGLLVVEPGLLLEMDGAARDDDDAAENLDTFDRILASIRFL